MAPYILEQPVKPGDLILLSAPGRKAEMLFVKHTSDGNESTSTESITAKPISWRIPIKKGHWTLDGPRVEYWEEEEDHEGQQSEHEMEKEDEYEYGIFEEVKLSEFLYSFNPLGAGDTGKGEDTQIMVNPHGRQVEPPLHLDIRAKPSYTETYSNTTSPITAQSAA